MCSNHNYASKALCNKCQEPKPLDADEGAAYSNARAAPSYAYQPAPPMTPPPPSAFAAAAALQRPAVAMPSSAPPPSANGNFRQGDWMCPACNNHNYASKAACNRCGMDKPPDADASFDSFAPQPYAGAPAFVDTGPAHPKGWREGDWMCGKCGNHNYASKSHCNRCQEPKPLDCGFGPAGRGKGPIQVAPYSMPPAPSRPTNVPASGWRVGDWICPTCNNFNYGCRASCNRCQEPFQPAYLLDGLTALEKGLPQAAAGMKGSCGSPAGGRPGDWNCPMCGNHNYHHRDKCNRCMEPKPSLVEAGVEGE